MTVMDAVMNAGMDAPVEKTLNDGLSSSTGCPGSEGVPSIPLSDFGVVEKSAATRAFEIGQDDEQTTLAWIRWQARRQKRLGRRSSLTDKYSSVHGEHNIGLCSSDCLQCKAAGSASPLDIMIMQQSR
jgi:hypothetical protein